MSRFVITSHLADLLEQLVKQDNPVTIDLNDDGVLVTVWRPERDGSHTELEKSGGATCEGAVIGVQRKISGADA